MHLSNAEIDFLMSDEQLNDIIIQYFTVTNSFDYCRR